MNELITLPPAAKYINKIKNKSLKKEFQNAIDDILRDPYTGTLKTGDLAGVYCYNKNNEDYRLTSTAPNRCITLCMAKQLT